MQLQMLQTIMTSQDKLTEEVKGIKESMVEIVRIEERQANQKEAISRIGRAVDRADERMDKQDADINELKTLTSTMAAKVGAMATVAATLITAIAMYAFDSVTK